MSSVAPDLRFLGWPTSSIQEVNNADHNGKVGTRLLSECQIARIWEIRLAPGERLAFHHHVLDYFWTVLTSGKAISRSADGLTHEIIYRRGDTKELRYGKGEGMIHDLENVGSTDLLFVTVEFVGSANVPLDPGQSSSTNGRDEALRSLLFRSYEAEAEPSAQYFSRDSASLEAEPVRPKVKK